MLLGSAIRLSNPHLCSSPATRGRMKEGDTFLASEFTLEYSKQIHGANVAISMALLAALFGRRALPIGHGDIGDVDSLVDSRGRPYYRTWWPGDRRYLLRRSHHHRRGHAG